MQRALPLRRLPWGHNALPFEGRVTTSTSTADIALPTRERERAEVSYIDAEGLSGVLDLAGEVPRSTLTQLAGKRKQGG